MVAVTIRGLGSILFYSVAASMPDFCSAVEFRYIYGVVLIEAKTLIYRAVIIFNIEKVHKTKLNREDAVFFLYLRHILAI